MVANSETMKNIFIRRTQEMEMCYDGALVMPSNYAVMDEEEMMYIEAGKKITITLAAVATYLGTQALKKAGKYCASRVGTALVANAGKIALWFIGSAWWLKVAVFACTGALIAGGLAFGITLVAKGSVTIGF